MKKKAMSLMVVSLLVLLSFLCLYRKRDEVKISYFKENPSNFKILRYQKQRRLFNEKIWHIIHKNNNRFRLTKRYVPKDNDEQYFFQEKEIVVVDDEFNFKRIEAFQQFSSGNNLSFGNIIGENPGKVWLIVNIIDSKSPNTFHMPNQIVEVTFRNSEPELHIYDIGEYKSIAIDVTEENVYIFREDQEYYEIYDLNTEDYVNKIYISGLGNYDIYKAMFNSRNNMVLVSGRVDGPDEFLGVIFENTLTVLDRSKDGAMSLWGTDDYIYSVSGAKVSRYDPSNKTKQIIFRPSVFTSKTQYRSQLSYDLLDSSLLILRLNYRFFFSNEITSSLLFLDTSEKEYSFHTSGHEKPL